MSTTQKPLSNEELHRATTIAEALRKEGAIARNEMGPHAHLCFTAAGQIEAFVKWHKEANG